MPKTVHVPDVPDDVHMALRVRAARSGVSLAEYLRRELIRLARRPSLDEFLDRAAPSSAISTEEIVAAVRADRDDR